ncbi:magnesium transporter [Dyadobacter sp. BE34]|uniref:Magnesium transporter MgtE n=1 Tax=Dyadobacter fermentans TaxID=94254 RepID=A0ABU1R6T2_9BACT|nr:MULTISPECIES: magnesium transporter [Dyadobacter]MDR6809111.1 magnesium transporter [Dyadobacter fermentans]MDR7046854.1 magnesium transporter [Dyadobacter sp. BE242]MDR7201168.1 magnesium transporter [Dyadobacter sp. BE34]MDR7219128.1 magnesium transporter [Dyadobacter sp. BE31]MDR7264662.1 magnesium transporter [Dyadobacter sp. BE32]
MTFELTQLYVDHIQELIEKEDSAAIRSEMENLFAADITSLLSELETESAKFLVNQLNIETGAAILADMDRGERRDFLKAFTSEEISKFVNLFDSDDAVDLLNEQPIRVREEVIALLEDREQARFILDLLHYDEDVAGGLMQKELIKANENWTVNQCIEELRTQAEDVEKVYAVYVVDDFGKLLGILSLKRIVLAHKNTKIESLYDKDVIFVETYRPAEEVAELMRRYDLDALPVVNVQGKLLGRITIDDIVDVITDQASSDTLAMAGITGDVEEDDSIWQQTKARLPWLLVGMMGGILAAKFISFFEGDLKIIPAMAAFIPIIGSTGGNVGIQTSSIILQGLADKTGIDTTLGQRLIRMFAVAFINGLIISAIVFGFNMLIGNDLQLALVVSTALMSVVFLASFMGTLTPILLEKIGINPAVASGPFITTANDLIGYGVYFGLAHLLLKL